MEFRRFILFDTYTVRSKDYVVVWDGYVLKFIYLTLDDWVEDNYWHTQYIYWAADGTLHTKTRPLKV